MKQKKSPHLNPLPKGEEVKDSLIAINGTILQKLSTLEDLLKKKDDKPLTFKETCVYLGYAPSYLYKLTYRKVIPHYKPTGKVIFFSKNEIDEWIFKSRIRQNDGGQTQDSVGSNGNDGSTAFVNNDPNQVDMFEKSEEKDIVIEFPLKSRRKQK